MNVESAAIARAGAVHDRFHEEVAACYGAGRLTVNGTISVAAFAARRALATPELPGYGTMAEQLPRTGLTISEAVRRNNAMSEFFALTTCYAESTGQNRAEADAGIPSLAAEPVQQWQPWSAVCNRFIFRIGFPLVHGDRVSLNILRSEYSQHCHGGCQWAISRNF